MNDLKVSDIMCKWYIWVAVGYVIGKNLSDTLVKCYTNVVTVVANKI